LGKPIELLEFDNQSTPVGAKLVAQKAVKADVTGVIGALWSSHSLAMAPVLQEAKIPMISPYSTNPKVTLLGNYIFRVCFIDTFQGAVMADFAINSLKAKTSIVLTDTSRDYSMDLAKFFMQTFKQKGGQILWEGDYIDETTNFSPLLEKIKNLQPDVVFIPGYYKDSGFIIKQARKLGLSMTFLGGDGWTDADILYKYGGKAINGNYFVDQWHRDVDSKNSQTFVKQYEQTNKQIIGATVALSYDATMLLADAVRRANSLDTIQIQNALANTKKYQGITGYISFNQNGDPTKSAVILKLDEGKSMYFKTVEPF